MSTGRGEVGDATEPEPSQWETDGSGPTALELARRMHSQHATGSQRQASYMGSSPRSPTPWRFASDVEHCEDEDIIDSPRAAEGMRPAEGRVSEGLGGRGSARGRAVSDSNSVDDNDLSASTGADDSPFIVSTEQGNDRHNPSDANEPTLRSAGAGSSQEPDAPGSSRWVSVQAAEGAVGASAQPGTSGQAQPRARPSIPSTSNVDLRRQLWHLIGRASSMPNPHAAGGDEEEDADSAYDEAIRTVQREDSASEQRRQQHEYMHGNRSTIDSPSSLSSSSRLARRFTMSDTSDLLSVRAQRGRHGHRDSAEDVNRLLEDARAFTLVPPFEDEEVEPTGMFDAPGVPNQQMAMTGPGRFLLQEARDVARSYSGVAAGLVRDPGPRKPGLHASTSSATAKAPGMQGMVLQLPQYAAAAGAAGGSPEAGWRRESPRDILLEGVDSPRCRDCPASPAPLHASAAQRAAAGPSSSAPPQLPGSSPLVFRSCDSDDLSCSWPLPG